MPFQSGSSFPCSSVLFLSKPGVGGLISAVQDPRVGVPDVELDSLAPQSKALCFCNPSLLPSLPPDLKPRSGGHGVVSLPLSPFLAPPLVVEAVVQVQVPFRGTHCTCACRLLVSEGRGEPRVFLPRHLELPLLYYGGDDLLLLFCFSWFRFLNHRRFIKRASESVRDE